MENKSTENKLSFSPAIALILLFCSISVFFIYQIYLEKIVFGSEAGKWVYPYFDTINSISIWIPVIVLSLTGIFIFLGEKLVQKYEIATLAGCFMLAFVIQVLLQKIYPYSMGQIISSRIANSFYTPAINYSVHQVLAQFQNLAKSFPPHARSNMPGKILLYQFMAIFTSSPQRMGYLIILFSSLGGPLLYGICKRLFQDKKISLYSFVLYSLIPSKQVFFPILNTVTPLFILICLYLFLTYLDSKNKLILALLGVSLYILVLFEPSPLAIGILFIGILIHAVQIKKILGKELFLIALIPTISFFATYLFFVKYFSFNLWQTFQFILKDASSFNIKVGRDYSIWIVENMKEFFYAAGMPVIMIFIFLLIGIIREWKLFLVNISNVSMKNLYILCLFFTFCIVLLLGINRGETTRLWIYLAVFFQPAAYFMAKTVKSNLIFFLLAGVIISQSIIELQRVGFIIP